MTTLVEVREVREVRGSNGLSPWFGFHTILAAEIGTATRRAPVGDGWRIAVGALARDDDDDAGLDPGPEALGWRLILSRVLAATVGAFLVCDMLAAAIGRHLPMGKVDAVLNSTMIGLVAYIGLAVWVIAAKSGVRMWAVLAALAAVFFAISII